MAAVKWSYIKGKRNFILKRLNTNIEMLKPVTLGISPNKQTHTKEKKKRKESIEKHIMDIREHFQHNMH